LKNITYRSESQEITRVKVILINLKRSLKLKTLKILANWG